MALSWRGDWQRRLTASYAGLGVIDEFRLIVNLAALGSGIPCFRIVQETSP